MGLQTFLFYKLNSSPQSSILFLTHKECGLLKRGSFHQGCTDVCVGLYLRSTHSRRIENRKSRGVMYGSISYIIDANWLKRSRRGDRTGMGASASYKKAGSKRNGNTTLSLIHFHTTKPTEPDSNLTCIFINSII